jgi:hypothetical protein
MSELVERLRTRTDRELEALGEGMKTKPVAPRRPAEAPRPHLERAGVGRDLVDETTRVIITGLDARIKAARKAGRADMVAELEARRKAILAEAEAAKE